MVNNLMIKINKCKIMQINLMINNSNNFKNKLVDLINNN